MVQKAIETAQLRNWQIAVAICDPFGALLAFGRSDGAIPEVVNFAIDKAYTAARMRCATATLFERAQRKPQLMAGLANRERLLLFPGGLPIHFEDAVIGAIGISGAQDHEDVELAQNLLIDGGFTYG